MCSSLFIKMWGNYSRWKFTQYFNILVAISTESTQDGSNGWKMDIQEDTNEPDCLFKSTNTNYFNKNGQREGELLSGFIICLLIFQMFSLNVLWECPKIQNFWKDVVRCLLDMFNTKVSLKAKLCVLGIYTKNFKTENKTDQTSGLWTSISNAC